MAKKRATVWPIEPHTRAKHEILKRYLQAWMPILSRGGFREILYIDGFAGPGRYSEGEDGSPLIAMKSAMGYKPPLTARITFLFVEKDKKRADHLSNEIKTLILPNNFEHVIESGKTFEEAFHKLYTRYENSLGKLPPTFAFIDPFGWKGVPFSIIKQIMKNKSCEVFINFMYEDINRFLNHKYQTKNFDNYFGTKRWREVLGEKIPKNRNRFLHDLYMDQMKYSANIKFVRSFEMRNKKGVVDYYLFYGTNNITGLKKMKEAMWKIDESGEFYFSDATDKTQPTLFEDKPNYDQLKGLILRRFHGLVTTVGGIEIFVLTETPFKQTHYKSKILRPLELKSPPEIEVIDPPAGRKRGNYPSESLKIRFLL